MKEGAYDYITKPVDLKRLKVLLDKVVERLETLREVKILRRQLREHGTFGPLVGNSPEMRKMYQTIEQAAPTSAAVLIMGESGTGKELVAQTIHQLSPRAQFPFVAINCAAIPETLLESELFGIRAGVATGVEARRGRFELADGGTLFLDEVGELNKNIQVKLLRFLESGEIRRVGETAPFRTDVRVLCATNCDLREMIAKDEFREDLFFRVNTFEIRLPPRRERRADIADLARSRLARAAKRPVEQVADLLGPDAVAVLQGYDWPGNVRELANVMEHAYILAGGGPITSEHLPQNLRHSLEPATLPLARPTVQVAPGTHATYTPKTLKEIEMDHILRSWKNTKATNPPPPPSNTTIPPIAATALSQGRRRMLTLAPSYLIDRTISPYRRLSATLFLGCRGPFQLDEVTHDSRKARGDAPTMTGTGPSEPRRVRRLAVVGILALVIGGVAAGVAVSGGGDSQVEEAGRLASDATPSTVATMPNLDPEQAGQEPLAQGADVQFLDHALHLELLLVGFSPRGHHRVLRERDPAGLKQLLQQRLRHRDT